MTSGERAPVAREIVTDREFAPIFYWSILVYERLD